MFTISEHLKTDFLIIGGGIAGLMAAISAREKGINVIIAEKANTLRSGSGAAGNDHFMCYYPPFHGDDIRSLVQQVVKSQVGPWLDRDLTLLCLERTFEMVQKWESWGIRMRPYGDSYEFMGHSAPGRKGLFLKYDGKNQKKVLTARAKNLGAKLLNHHTAIELSASNNVVNGALLLDTSHPEPVFRTVEAKTVLIATGCAVRLYSNKLTPGWMFNINQCPADAGGMALGYRIGARLINMEHPYQHIGTRYFARSGKGTWIGMYRLADNSPLGPFLEKPHRAHGDVIDNVWRDGFDIRMKEGRGPVYLDCTGLSNDDYSFMRAAMFSEGLGAQVHYMDESGIDLSKHVVEFGAYQAFVFGRGLDVDIRAETSVKGLYAAGETTGNFRAAIAGAAVWGWIAGESAAEDVQNGTLPASNFQSGDFNGQLEYFSSLFRQDNGADWEEANLLLQQIMSDYAPMSTDGMRSETMLRAGIRYLGLLREKMQKDLRVECSHTLMRALEVRDLVDLGEGILYSARARKESRGLHKRSDYPFTNPMYDDKFLMVFRNEGKVHTEWRACRMI